MIKKNLFLLAMLLSSVSAYAAGGQAAYQQGIDFTKDQTGGVVGGKNASNIQNLINIFLANKNISQTTGAQTNPNLNSGSQGAADINTLKNFYNSSNVSNNALESLNQPGGRGDQKKQYCLDYVDPVKTPSPDPTKYAECQAVNELNKTPIKDYKANTGFSKSDAIFSSGSQLGQARQMITDSPQDQVLAKVGIGANPGGSGLQCTTVNKTTAPQTTEGQCSRAAIPDSTPCEKSITPRVMLEKYCDASGGGVVTSNIVAQVDTSFSMFGGGSSTWSVDPATGLQPFYSQTTSRFRVDYRCGPPDLNGDVSTIIAKITPIMAPVSHWGGCDAGAGPWPASYDLLFAPGVSTNPAWVMYGRTGYWGGKLSGCSSAYDYATYWYDGAEDRVMIDDHNLSSEVGGGYMNSCPPGIAFVDRAIPYAGQTCTSQPDPNDPWGSPITVCSPNTQYARPAYCDDPAVLDTVTITPVVTSTAGSIGMGFDAIGMITTVLNCPATHPYPGNFTVTGKNTCYNAVYNCPAISGDTWLKDVIPPAGYLGSGAPNFQSGYCTRKKSVQAIRQYAPAPLYAGGAGVRARLKEDVIDSCAQYQAQAPDGPAASGGSYAPTTKLVDTCPADFVLISSDGTNPAYCRQQQIPVAAIPTTTYSCPQGGTPDASGICSLQEPNYPAVSTRKYTCPTGDVIDSAGCPNGGVSNGTSCTYPPLAATMTSQTCPAGTYLVNNLCYTNMLLSSTITAPNGTTVFDSNKTFSCAAGDTLNGHVCERPAQTVMCDHQPASVDSYGINHYNCPAGTKTGVYELFYSIADNTVQTNSCVPAVITKSASLQRRHCDAPYTYNSTSDKCEYQMSDYATSSYEDCSGNPGYTYTATNPVGQRCWK